MSTRQSMFLVLGACVALGWVSVAAAQGFPATGQTTCYDNSGSVIPCAGTGQDGEIQAGATLRYQDNGNGTILDRNTGLVWEKKSDDGGIHDQDDSYPWDEAFDYVDALNNICANDETVDCSVDADCAGVGGGCGFAGERDWRLPNAKEIQSIMNYEVFAPSVSSAFNNNCTAGATVLTGSCTATSLTWTSTTFARNPSSAWDGFFRGGFVTASPKNNLLRVRAVRAGFSP